MRAIVYLKRNAKSLCKSDDSFEISGDSYLDLRKESKALIIRKVQFESNESQIQNLSDGIAFPKTSTIPKLGPFLDPSGILRVGGRLKLSALSPSEKHPILITSSHHFAKLLVLRFHRLTRHQGRHITEDSIITSGFWITSLKRLISSSISN